MRRNAEDNPVLWSPHAGEYCIIEVNKDKGYPNWKVLMGNLTKEKAEEIANDWNEDNPNHCTVEPEDIHLGREEFTEYWGD